MVTRDVGKLALKQQLSLLGTTYLFADHGPTASCLSQQQLRELGEHPQAPDPTTQHHLNTCDRCAYSYTAFKGMASSRALPPVWRVPLIPDAFEHWHPSDTPVQLFAHVSLESRNITSCEEDEWHFSPRQLRLTVVLDKVADFVGLTILDVPSTVQAAALLVPHGRVKLDHQADLSMLQAAESLTEIMQNPDVDDACHSIVSAVEAGHVSIEFTSSSDSNCAAEPQTSSVVELLNSAGAIETKFDYELPSGLHSDTHINVGRICQSENLLQEVADSFRELFQDCTFDTVLTNGWAMATIARRLEPAHSNDRISDPIDEIICDGYHKLLLTGDLLQGSRVLILVDVNVTGSLVQRMRSKVEAAGATTVAIGCLVEAESSKSVRPHGLRSLCQIPMDLVDPSVEACVRCQVLEPRVFNPVSHSMTQRAAYPRSPSEFLANNGKAREFWQFVDLAHAYEHHHKEENTHYIAFVDTRKMLEHAEVGPRLVSQLSNLIATTFLPDVLFVPNRPRGRVLANLLAPALSPGPQPLPIVVAQRPRRRPGQVSRTRPWYVRPADLQALTGNSVLVVDAAAGHGTTIDRLVRLASACDATRVGAAVLISRLTETCENSFSTRLSGFSCLFHLPIRPVVIRGRDASLCPICQRKAAIEQVAEASGVEAIQRWTAQVKRRFRPPTTPSKQERTRDTQLHLFPIGEDFLETCRESVASGVTLHALNAAMTNGMAPLTLPELFNNRIRSRSRTAMVENLPQGAVEWSGEILADDLREFLVKGTAPNVWRASAEVLVKEGESDWLTEVDDMITRLRHNRPLSSSTFWNYLACTASIAVAQNPDLEPTIRGRLANLTNVCEGTAEAEGLQRVLDTLSKTTAPTAT